MPTAGRARPGALRARSIRLAAQCEGGPHTCAAPDRRSRATRLTRSEWEIAELAANGNSNTEIAACLRISVRTVESHLYHAMTKLGTTRQHLPALCQMTEA